MPLLSPSYSLAEFCYRVPDVAVLAVIERASSEIAEARRLHRHKTKESTFRRGSKGAVYCAQLQLLVSSLLNGTVPAEATPSFRSDAAPLVNRLLQSQQIGTLRAEFEAFGA